MGGGQIQNLKKRHISQTIENKILKHEMSIVYLNIANTCFAIFQNLTLKGLALKHRKP